MYVTAPSAAATLGIIRSCMRPQPLCGGAGPTVRGCRAAVAVSERWESTCQSKIMASSFRCGMGPYDLGWF
ncbi:hypothetical protein BDA96_04G080900 [Sorghum bicolor]|uniref:Uncharacterized protein n=1 Tax=Sorghum bicolor TaxID=4558 RepID=A0A921UHR0_SORBI|nr:hypothetical protein BDA96_04G080900 [Sorghum bicolor]